MFQACCYNVDTRYTTELGSYPAQFMAFDALAWHILASVPSNLHVITIRKPFGYDVFVVKRKKTTRTDFCYVKYMHALRCFIKRD